MTYLILSDQPLRVTADPKNVEHVFVTDFYSNEQISTATNRGKITVILTLSIHEHEVPSSTNV